ncbi:SGNH/GDSL hydrolase family protein [Legionella sainthelensi]|uniref:Lipase n=1 Tax=Legionella sainthelensi TaxID=28087 RepID=A0A2H5FKA1_9GAMM|nr:SGNH/GDSL hydrolase family protein [Legionella sainthelensi]AUH71988.1 lipase [Legionella sainthelensi]
MLKKVMKHIQRNISRSARLAVVCLSLVNSAHAIPFDRISQVYFFGDSLTDSGYNDYFPTPPGKAPTFTTYEGYTWSQYVARDIKGFALTSPTQYPITYPNLPNDEVTNNTTPPIQSQCPSPACPVSGMLKGVDYAAGGSSTNSIGFGLKWAPSLHAQVNQFLTTHPTIDPKAMIFIWSGANDLLTVFSTSSTSPIFQLLLLETANAAAKNIAEEIALLSKHGAKRVVVLSLPNIGYTPFINDLVTVGLAPPSLPGDMKTATFTFNSMLNQELGRVKAKYGTKILYVDVYDLLDNVILATKAGKPYVIGGESFYFTNYNSPVCGYVVPLTPGVLPSYVSAIVCTMGSNGYVFADELHPTDMAHRLLSIAVEQQIRRWI